jgi:uncharacterized protein YdhG (YjbR/CyaY superfamily)
MKKAPKDVEEYIESAPGAVRGKLREMRAAILEVVPGVPERISYGMPCYGEKGRSIYFGIAKAHIGLYGISAPIIERYRDEVTGYLAQKGTIRLPLDEGLPIGLIKRLVKARMDDGEVSIRQRTSDRQI